MLQLFTLLLFLSACSPEKNSEVTNGVVSPSVERGKSIYRTQCIACHNTDPHKPGSLGPEVFGSSKELLQVRILQAGYPEGYKPKRDTKSMIALPHLKDEIESIRLYLNSNE